MRYLLLGNLFIFLAINAFAESAVCRKADYTEIASLFDRWNTALKTGEPTIVVANYSKDSVLIPTLSNKARLTPDEKIDYFKYFLAKNPIGKIDSRVIKIWCNTALDSGIYTFTFNDGSVTRARYTFTYEWDGNQWLISSHHSSLMPDKE